MLVSQRQVVSHPMLRFVALQSHLLSTALLSHGCDSTIKAILRQRDKKTKKTRKKARPWHYNRHGIGALGPESVEETETCIMALPVSSLSVGQASLVSPRH